MPPRKQYVVTAYVNRLGRRDTISKKMSSRAAKDFKINTMLDLKLAIPRYKWCKQLKIEER